MLRLHGAKIVHFFWSPFRMSSSVEPFQAGAVLHKQEPLGKWRQGKSRAGSRSKLAMGKRAQERQGTSGALEAQEQQASS